MDLNPDFKELLKEFNAEKVRYLIVGAYAYIHHLEPRYTKDLDIWIAADPENAKRTWNALRRYGAPLSGITIEDFASQRTIYQMGVEPNRIDIITTISGVDFEAAWKKRVKADYAGVAISVLNEADFIKNKQTAGRDQDLLDVKKLLAKRRRRKPNR
jgi:hypothetical protein